ncbi:hypothetical protein [Clostridium sp. HMP27]|uniref:hypothetical protein n=1 Tax=Clostridium sp. HMP27 TaxID=1487921 RepID=UPI00052E1AF7|nr:hypothetical protein [Clostridium sp. HMP27]KGK85849.1 hypothetical protein DP68_15590 [Clostridium sp. HMP27]
MAIERRDRSIILTGETAKNFNYKMKSLDPDVIYKRDKFIRDSKEKIQVHKSNGKITLIIK